MRALVIDDCAVLCAVIKKGLEHDAFTVDVASDGQAGLEKAIKNLGDYDVILLDWMLPGKSGIAICESIRKINRQIPIIFLTSNNDSEDAVAAFEAGATDYLRKPFAIGELLARIWSTIRSIPGQQIELSPKDHLIFNHQPILV
jgi:two-component system, OmpR family, copper resistance phosphate regulon response regulator CusR